MIKVWLQTSGREGDLGVALSEIFRWTNQSANLEEPAVAVVG